MKAATLIRKGDPYKAFELREHPKPEPKAHEVLIKVEAFGLNFADVMARQGLYQDAPPTPSVLGYEVSGTVESAGSDEWSHLIGKRVVAMTRFGGYAEYATTNAAAVAEIPSGMTSEEATALATQYCTAYYNACIRMNLFEGDHVLIHAAAGGVGIAMCQIAKWKGCTVYGTASQPEKLKFLKSIGVDHPINYRTSDYEAEVRKLLPEGRKLNASFNAVGGKTFKKDLKIVGNGGTIVCFGAADRNGRKGGFFANLKLLFGMGFLHPLFMMMKSKGVIGVNMLTVADHQPEMIQRCIQSVIELTEQGVLKPHVGGVFPAEEIGKAHAFLEGRKSMGKVVVKW